MKSGRQPPATAPHVDLEAERARIRAWIAYSARTAARDPAKAKLLGIAPTPAMSLFAPADAGIYPSEADWMRGAVTALLPSGWTWSVEEDIQGRAFLQIFRP